MNSSSHENNNYQTGITLTQLLITLLLSIILVLYSIPSFNHLYAAYESRSTILLVNHLIQISRSRAFSHHQRIAICGSNDLVNCSEQNWNQGILVFVDRIQRDRIRQSDEQIIAAHALTLKYGQLSWQGAGGNNIIFEPHSGMARGANGSFFYCAVDSKHSKKLILSYMGHTRVEQPEACP